MPATFKVVGTLALRSRKQLIVLGDLIDGEVARGMTFDTPTDSGPRVTGKVDSIEYVDFRSLRERHPAIVLHCDEEAELDIWREKLREGLVLSLK
jgi:hypothetical protein